MWNGVRDKEVSGRCLGDSKAFPLARGRLRVSGLQEVRTLLRRRLLATEAVVIAAKVSVAEGATVGLEWAKRWIVAGGVAEVAVMLRAITATVVGIASAIVGAGTETVVVGEVNEWGTLSVRRRWRWVIGMRSATGCEQSGSPAEGEEQYASLRMAHVHFQAAFCCAGSWRAQVSFVKTRGKGKGC
jgi:hypothetical protein